MPLIARPPTSLRPRQRFAELAHQYRTEKERHSFVAESEDGADHLERLGETTAVLAAPKFRQCHASFDRAGGRTGKLGCVALQRSLLPVHVFRGVDEDF